jgi:endonuclease/exonuclease/phosphatase family metal-dependent hydrolase
MTFNIRNMRSRDGENSWDRRQEMVSDLIRRHGPDILATQEAYFPQVEALRQALPGYVVLGVGRDDGRRAGEHCALFVRADRWSVGASGTFWFSETPDVPGSRHWTPEHARICTWASLIGPTGPPFVVYNVHMDHEAQVARQNSARLIAEHIRNVYPETPALVTGDFNMEEDNPAMQALVGVAGPGLVDTFRALHPMTTPRQGTFHGFTGARDGEKIDYILASPAFQTQETQIVYDNAEGRYPSDHFPLTARVRLED